MVIVSSIALDADAISGHNNANIQLNEQVTKEVNIEVTENGEKTAIVTTKTTINGNEKI